MQEELRLLSERFCGNSKGKGDYGKTIELASVGFLRVLNEAGIYT